MKKYIGLSLLLIGAYAIYMGSRSVRWGSVTIRPEQNTQTTDTTTSSTQKTVVDAEIQYDSFDGKWICAIKYNSGQVEFKKVDTIEDGEYWFKSKGVSLSIVRV